MYESPITLMIKEMAGRAAKHLDEETFKAVRVVLPAVDQEELIRALRYDRGQYQKGYADGMADAEAALVHCKNCIYGEEAKENDKGFLICPASGMEITDNDFCSYGERKEDWEG